MFGQNTSTIFTTFHPTHQLCTKSDLAGGVSDADVPDFRESPQAPNVNSSTPARSSRPWATSFAGLSSLDLNLVSHLDFGSGAVAMRYEPRTQPFLRERRQRDAILLPRSGSGVLRWV
jgi:hypothetical protein